MYFIVLQALNHIFSTSFPIESQEFHLEIDHDDLLVTCVCFQVYMFNIKEAIMSHDKLT